MTIEPTAIYNVGTDFTRNAGITLPYPTSVSRSVTGLKSAIPASRRAMPPPWKSASPATRLDEVVALAAPKMKVSEAALKAALTSKRLTFEPLSMPSARGRDSVLSAADYLFKNGVIEKPVGTDFLTST